MKLQIFFGNKLQDPPTHHALKANITRTLISGKFADMGLVNAQITLSNPIETTLQPITVSSLIDTGANYLCIPQHLANQLRLQTLEEREVTVADGSKKICAYVGPVKVAFANRQCFVGALVLGQAVLLGAIPIEDMDLIVHPALLKLTVNPENPNIAGAVAMGIQ